jgi:hypothetical protein
MAGPKGSEVQIKFKKRRDCWASVPHTCISSYLGSWDWTPVLKGASDRTCPLFKHMFRHLCNSDPNLISGPTLKSLDPIDKTVLQQEWLNITGVRAKGSPFPKVNSSHTPTYFFTIKTLDVRAFIAPVIRCTHTSVFALLTNFLGLSHSVLKFFFVTSRTRYPREAPTFLETSFLEHNQFQYQKYTLKSESKCSQRVSHHCWGFGGAHVMFPQQI